MPAPARRRSPSSCCSRPGRSRASARVDDGTAHLDFEPEEQKRRESLSLAVGTFEYDGTRISLVDTPGYPDFVAEVDRGLRRRRRRAVRDGRLRRASRPAWSRRSRWVARPTPRPASSSTSATARTPTRPPRSTPCARRSATRSRRSSWPSARPSRSAAMSTSSTARRTAGTATTRSRSPSRTTSPTRSPAAATSCSRPRPRPTTTS